MGGSDQLPDIAESASTPYLMSAKDHLKRRICKRAVGDTDLRSAIANEGPAFIADLDQLISAIKRSSIIHAWLRFSQVLEWALPPLCAPLPEKNPRMPAD
jgi:hypothetical protein